ncbi:MAG: hypothetical protein QOG32_1131 [Chloroflexota bacterium]|nr:hypothetical protein [Chloroflexota bacterium]
MTVGTMVRPDVPRARSVELVLAHAHLRLGLLALARTELETLAGLGRLGVTGLVDLAEVRWRSGDMVGAGEAAAAALRGDEEDPIALLIAAEAAMELGRPSEARRLASRAMAAASTSIDVIFAGMPRSAAWPPDADEPPPTAPTMFDRAPESMIAGEGGLAGAEQAEAAASQSAAPIIPSGPVMRGFWDEDVPEDPASRVMPDPALELEAGRAALVEGALDDAALRFGIAVRLAPALAPAILEATAGARVPSLLVVRGDAYRVAGHEAEAQEAYLVAAHGGLPERRKRSRGKPPTPAAATPTPHPQRAPSQPGDDKPDVSIPLPLDGDGGPSG